MICELKRLKCCIANVERTTFGIKRFLNNKTWYVYLQREFYHMPPTSFNELTVLRPQAVELKQSFV